MEDGSARWPGISVDLTGAHLENFSLTNCIVGRVNFTKTVFAGATVFDNTYFLRPATRFRQAAFHRPLLIKDVHFQGKLLLSDCTFELSARFTNVRCSYGMEIKEVASYGGFFFSECQYTHPAVFSDSDFNGFVGMRDCKGTKLQIRNVCLEKGIDFRENWFESVQLYDNTRCYKGAMDELPEGFEVGPDDGTGYTPVLARIGYFEEDSACGA
jgi:hypothetical protein